MHPDVKKEMSSSFVTIFPPIDCYIVVLEDIQPINTK